MSGKQDWPTSAKLFVLNAILLAQLILAGLGFVAFEAISIWHFLKLYANLR